MKIAVFGLTYPFRGGISHHTTLLCENLKNNHKVKLFSFNRLYPSFLFPGVSQKDKDSKEKIAFPNESCIDSLNPFTWFSTYRKIKKFKPDLLILQWWTPLFFPVYFTVCWLIKKFTGRQNL